MQARNVEEDVRIAKQAAKGTAKTAELIATMESSNTKIHERFEVQHQTLVDIIESQNSIQAVLEEKGVEGSIRDLSDVAAARKVAIEQVAKVYESVLTALQRALTQEALSEEESLALFRSSRLKLLVREKVAQMAHVPCTTSAGAFVQQSEGHPFTIQATDSEDFLEVLCAHLPVAQQSFTETVFSYQIRSSWCACSTTGGLLGRWGTILSVVCTYIHCVRSLSSVLKVDLCICRARAGGRTPMKPMASIQHSSQHLHSTSRI